MDLTPTFFGLLAAALFGLLIHFQRRGLESCDPLIGAFISVLAMTALLWILSPFFISYNWILSKAALIFFLGGLFFPASAQVAQASAKSSRKGAGWPPRSHLSLIHI